MYVCALRCTQCSTFFFFNDTATTEIYTLSLHDALPICKKTHANRCSRLKEAGFNDEQINKIFGPIGIKLGGRSAPEIALSIIAQLVSEAYKK